MKRLALITATVLVLLPGLVGGRESSALPGLKIATFTFGPVVLKEVDKPIWPAKYNKKMFDTVSKDLRLGGFTVDVAQASPAVVKVAFHKVGVTPGRGVFNVKWTREVVGEAYYLWTAESWALEKVVVGAKEKPPQYQDWTAIVPDVTTADKLKAVFGRHKQISPSG